MPCDKKDDEFKEDNKMEDKADTITKDKEKTSDSSAAVPKMMGTCRKCKIPCFEPDQLCHRQKPKWVPW